MADASPEEYDLEAIKEVVDDTITYFGLCAKEHDLTDKECLVAVQVFANLGREKITEAHLPESED